MIRKLLPFAVALVILAFPFRWAYLEDTHLMLQTVGMILTIVGFFAVVILFDKASESSH